MQFKVWNDNTHTHRELFKGEKIEIPPKEFILMNEDDAIHFRGQFVPPILDGDGQPLPTSYKMIRLEKVEAGNEDATPKATTYRCHACQFVSERESDLTAHLKDSHKEAVAVDELAEKELKSRKKAS